MARVSADLSNVEQIKPIPKDNYKAHIDAFELKDSKGGNPMVVNSWMIDEGPYSGRKINYDTIVLSGTDKNGNPINPFRLGQLLSAAKIPWNCLNCNRGDKVQELEFSDGSGGKQKGKYYCPDCDAPMKVDFDTDHLQGARCVISVSVEPDDKGNEWNRIVGYADIGILD